MRAGIFAAGFGSRLGAGGRPKGLTPINGRPLVDWIVEDLAAAGVTDLVVIINEQSTALRDHVMRRTLPVPIRWIVETTPSSMHSFLRVLEALAEGGDPGPFLLTTVDTIAPPGTFAAFLARCAGRGRADDVVLALTALVDDENPLRIDLDAGDVAAGGRVTAIGAGAFATAGYYLVNPSVLREAAAARRTRLAALRGFFGYLFERGYRFTGIAMPDSIDVDRPADVAAAERLLRATTP